MMGCIHSTADCGLFPKVFLLCSGSAYYHPEMDSQPYAWKHQEASKNPQVYDATRLENTDAVSHKWTLDYLN